MKKKLLFLISFIASVLTFNPLLVNANVNPEDYTYSLSPVSPSCDQSFSGYGYYQWCYKYTIKTNSKDSTNYPQIQFISNSSQSLFFEIEYRYTLQHPSHPSNNPNHLPPPTNNADWCLFKSTESATISIPCYDFTLNLVETYSNGRKFSGYLTIPYDINNDFCYGKNAGTCSPSTRGRLRFFPYAQNYSSYNATDPVYYTINSSLYPTTTVPPTTTVSPTPTPTTASPTITTPSLSYCQASQNPSYPTPTLSSWFSINNINSFYNYYNSYNDYSYPRRCQDNHFKYLEIKDNTATWTQSSSAFSYYFNSMVSNCWQIRGVWDGGSSNWSNKICYDYVPSTTTTTTTTTTIPKVVTSFNTSYYFSAPKATPKPKTKKVKVKQTTFYRTGAICRDGWRSRATGSGACSHHGGVYKWLVINKTTWVTKTVPIIPKTPKSSNNCYLCYSNINGLPKTTYVNGYFKSDGSYVNGYWRSK